MGLAGMGMSNSNTEFKPYKPEDTYKVVLTKNEALLIQKLRAIDYGAVTVHLVNKKIVRTETTNSQLTKDQEKDEITIALEVISN